MTVPDWKNIRARAARFAKDWADAHYEKGQTHTFYNEFFQLFGVSSRRFLSFEVAVKKMGGKRGFIDLFWPGMLLVEQKSAGRSLQQARAQALGYLDALADYELPRYILLSDFQRFELLDLDKGSEVAFTLAQLPQHVEHFAFIRGDEMQDVAAQEAVNIKAAELVGRLHDLLQCDHYAGEDLQILLVRLVFCLFADDTGIFESSPSRSKHPFEYLVRNHSSASSNNLGRLLMELFDVLNTPPGRRQKSLAEELAQFPYINGSLFAGSIRIPVFDAAMREALLNACAFDWRAVSPAIFGSLFQSIMNRQERREQGAHYTGEAHILRLIKPLFLDALDAEFERICAMRQVNVRNAALQKLQDHIAALALFDPACGCGNFLVVAYQKLRALETALLKTLHGDTQLTLDAREWQLSRVNVHQCYGIEINPFAARIAQVALWMTDHLCNLELGNTFGAHYSRIPLTTAPHIHCADALEVDWHSILPARQCSYLLGNPPFIGAKYQSEGQRQQVRRIANLGKSGGTLDYVCAWWLTAAQYVQDIEHPPHIAFVSTNSITQGEQVAQLWPLLFQRYGMEIAFAHRTFTWQSDARGAAHVHVVIIGLSVRGSEAAEKRLFSDGEIKGESRETRHKALSPYLIDASTLPDAHLVVKEEARSLMGYPALIIGSKPIDDGQYIFTDAEKAEFLQMEPQALSLLRPFLGAQEFINGRQRWILALQQATPQQLRAMPEVVKRMEAVKKYRLASKSKPTQALAQTPTRYHVNVIPEKPFLVIPQVSSEKREYIPIGYLRPPVIPSDKLRIMLHAELWHFAILTSRMHMAWMRIVTGRMKSDYMYSIGVVYNAFPWPEGLQENTRAQEKLTPLAQAVLDARAAQAGASLADLYHPTTMPPAVRRAHQALDKAVDRLYQAEAFADDAARVSCLLARYAALVGAGQ